MAEQIEKSDLGFKEDDNKRRRFKTKPVTVDNKESKQVMDSIMLLSNKLTELELNIQAIISLNRQIVSKIPVVENIYLDLANTKKVKRTGDRDGKL